MKEQFEMKLPKRSETSDFVKEQEKITCPRVCGTKSEAEGVLPLPTALRLPGSPWAAGVGVTPQG